MGRLSSSSSYLHTTRDEKGLPAAVHGDKGVEFEELAGGEEGDPAQHRDVEALC